MTDSPRAEAGFCDLQKTFRDRHRGKMAFLIGNGPSAHAVDPEALKPYITLTINEGIFKFEDATYFFSCDGTVWSGGLLQRLKELDRATQIILASDKKPMATGVIPRERVYYVQRKPGVPKQQASKEDSQLLLGSSSAHPAAHLLHTMGCDPIVLIGCDCKIKEGVYAFWTLQPYYANATQYYHDIYGSDAKATYDKTSQKRGSAPLDAMCGTHHDYWKFMSGFQPKWPIIDASDGRLECFQKMKLEDVLSVYGERKNCDC